jgi:hypothetical protein
VAIRTRLLFFVNALFALYFAFLFTIPFLGIDDDADLAQVAWGHEAFRHLQDNAGLAFHFALSIAPLNWLWCVFNIRDWRKANRTALQVSLLTLGLMLCGSVIGAFVFYFTKPVGP